MLANDSNLASKTLKQLATAFSSNDQSTVGLVEVSASGIPDSSEYKYKVRVQVFQQGTEQLNQLLMTRLQPNWLVDIVHESGCIFVLTLLYRQGGLGQPWERAGSIEISDEALSEGDRSIEVKQSVDTWAQAPALVIQARFTKSTYDSQSDEIVSLNSATTSRQARGYVYSGSSDTASEEAIALPDIVPLTMPEAVIVKDVWNKLRAWKELEMETFFKGLLLEAPEPDYIFSEAYGSLPDYFFEMFDCCVRELCPHTETVVWEAKSYC